MDRALRANILAKSGKAVEVAGDVDTLLLDKTGTITIGNRKATRFVPFDGFSATELGRLAAQASAADQTPEGKSIVELYHQLEGPAGGNGERRAVPAGAQFVAFSAQTRMSGIDLADGQQIRKGAPTQSFDTSKNITVQLPQATETMVANVASQGRDAAAWCATAIASPAWSCWKIF